MASTYEKIATTTTTGSATTVTFSSISSTYTDLVVIGAVQGTRNTYGGDFNLRFNGDSGANYSQPQLVGTGSSATTGYYSGINGINSGGFAGADNGRLSTVIWHVFNYSNTNVYKAVMGSRGQNAVLMGGQWNSNSAINSVTCFCDGSYTFVAGSVFSLYGIKAA